MAKCVYRVVVVFMLLMLAAWQVDPREPRGFMAMMGVAAITSIVVTVRAAIAKAERDK